MLGKGCSAGRKEEGPASAGLSYPAAGCCLLLGGQQGHPCAAGLLVLVPAERPGAGSAASQWSPAKGEDSCKWKKASTGPWSWNPRCRNSCHINTGFLVGLAKAEARCNNPHYFHDALPPQFLTSCSLFSPTKYTGSPRLSQSGSLSWHQSLTQNTTAASCYTALLPLHSTSPLVSVSSLAPPAAKVFLILSSGFQLTLE